ncbi:hypothetical protein [Streptomyces sp. NPDC056628]|uniref:hypothetical protein n=1 Tax=Streptomyces sp. NPDC056628 TaxID=3345882 RepID=UPI0036AD6C94
MEPRNAGALVPKQVLTNKLFTDDAVTLIHTTSRGFPRAVNNLCLQSLVATFAAGRSLVDEKAAQSAVTEVLD